MFFCLWDLFREFPREISADEKAGGSPISCDGSLHEKACDRLIAQATLAKRGAALLPLISCRGGSCQETGLGRLVSITHNINEYILEKR